MKIKSIRAGVHRLSVTVLLLKEPIVRNAVICEVETDEGYVRSDLTGRAYLPFAIVTAIENESKPTAVNCGPFFSACALASPSPHVRPMDADVI